MSDNEHVAAHEEPFAYDISDVVRKGPVGRTKIYEEINAGRLTARKMGKRTIILREDFEEWLRNLPEMEAAHAST